MATFIVDSDALSLAESQLRATSSRIQADVAAMHQQLVALQDSWSGTASTAFQGVLQQWRGAQQQVESSLEQINTALGVAGAQYTDVELANARMFS